MRLLRQAHHRLPGEGEAKAASILSLLNRACEAYGRSIRREEIEGAFGEILQSLRPTRETFDMTHKGLRLIRQRLEGSAAERKKALAAEIVKVERGIAQLVDRVIDSDSSVLVAAYEQRIREAEFQKVELKE